MRTLVNRFIAAASLLVALETADAQGDFPFFVCEISEGATRSFELGPSDESETGVSARLQHRKLGWIEVPVTVYTTGMHYRVEGVIGQDRRGFIAEIPLGCDGVCRSRAFVGLGTQSCGPDRVLTQAVCHTANGRWRP